MGSLRDKFAAFMYGRYGIDQLYKALIVLYFILFFIGFFVNSIILSIIMWAILIVTIFRTFSRNVYKRRSENEKFLKIWNPVKAQWFITIRRVKEFKTHRFRKCTHCRSLIRLPRKTGKHTVECPCCHKDFHVNILF